MKRWYSKPGSIRSKTFLSHSLLVTLFFSFCLSFLFPLVSLDATPTEKPRLAVSFTWPVVLVDQDTLEIVFQGTGQLAVVKGQYWLMTGVRCSLIDDPFLLENLVRDVADKYIERYDEPHLFLIPAEKRGAPLSWSN